MSNPVSESYALSRVASFNYTATNDSPKKIFSDLKDSFYKIIINGDDSSVLVVEIMNKTILSAFTNIDFTNADSEDKVKIEISGDSFITNFLRSSKEYRIYIDYYDEFTYKIESGNTINLTKNAISLTKEVVYKNNIHSTTVKIAQTTIETATFNKLKVGEILLGNWSLTANDNGDIVLSASHGDKNIQD